MFNVNGASCLEHDPTHWDPDSGMVDPYVARVCAMCPLNDICLEWALTHDEFGIWAGLTRMQRLAVRRGKRRARCPACQANQLWEGEDDQTCAFCGLSWNVRRKRAEPVR